jgi:glyoxylase-like metal-dependent hydrolase (beta-lactamase superfamily II)
MDTAPGHPEIARFVAPNPSAMTLDGTNSYVVGSDPAYVIDPGPDDAGHIQLRLRRAGANPQIAFLTQSHLLLIDAGKEIAEAKRQRTAASNHLSVGAVVGNHGRSLWLVLSGNGPRRVCFHRSNRLSLLD